ncbi:MAG TPA: sigma-54 dependent transcriptional regulator [Candidatus Udaeobacter sp.]|nr:sigma-54 dependent transcriptional regulator [Candidatus Udaeobacter sp.]
MTTQNPIVLVVDDEAHIRESLEKTLVKEGWSVLQAASGQEGLDQLRQQPINVAVCDLRMPITDGIQFLKAAQVMSPETAVIVMTGYGTVQTAVEAVKLGAFDFIEKPFKRLELIKSVRMAIERQTLMFENKRLREELEGEAAAPRHVIGSSRGMRQVIELVNQVAESTATILIEGESGTGKEVIANAIHYRSARKDRPFVKVSCAALPETLLEAELFGYEKGAFTGAAGRKVGRFELADTGTLFMDEVGEIPPSMQVKLLRVIQEGEFERLGGTKTLRVDVRLVAATNRRLSELVKQGKFREDLYYRLNVITVAIPPLRERPEDIPILADHFIRRYAQRNHRTISGMTKEAMEQLVTYSWPGNVRELENTIERAIVLSRDPMIGVDALPPTVTGSAPTSGRVMIPIGTKMRDVQRRMILETLKHTNGNRELAAKLMGIASRTIYRRMGPQAANEPGGGEDDGPGLDDDSEPTNGGQEPRESAAGNSSASPAGPEDPWNGDGSEPGRSCSSPASPSQPAP